MSSHKLVCDGDRDFGHPNQEIYCRKDQKMLWNIDFRDKRPIYEQIVSGMEDEILHGIMAPDEPLPSVRTLAMELSINPNTIQKAYRRLEADGYTYSVPGRGSFVCDVEGVRNMKKKEMIERITDLVLEAKKLGISDKEITAAINRTSDVGWKGVSEK